jgi:hypothetical protein
MRRSAVPRRRKAPAKRAKGKNLTKSSKNSTPANSTHISVPRDEGKSRIGLESAIVRVVTHQWTIAAYDPRLPAVLSTPAMIGMIEIAAAQTVLPELPPGAITMGTYTPAAARPS